MPARKIRFVGFGRFVCFGAFVLFGFGVVRWGGHGGTGRGTVGAGGRVVPESKIEKRLVLIILVIVFKHQIKIKKYILV